MPLLDDFLVPDAPSVTDQLLAWGDGALPLDEKVKLAARARRVSPEASHEIDIRMLDEIRGLKGALRVAAGKQEALKELINKVTAPPLHPAVLIDFARLPNGMSAVVAQGDARRVVAISPEVNSDSLMPGVEVLLGPERNVIVAVSPRRVLTTGETATFERMTPDRRMIVRSRDEDVVVDVAHELRGASLQPGDSVRWSRALGLAFEKVDRPEDRERFLEDTPIESFAEVGGLDPEIARLTRSIRLQRDHGETAARYGLRPKRSVLLSGPPGTGKTLLARALANWLASISPSGRSRFCPIKPGALSSVWFGQTEANLRSLFAAAKAEGEQNPDIPVVIWLDEVDGIGAHRGTSFGRVDDRVLLALMAELDGFESRGNVLVVAATNRKGDLDPGLLRPGRLGDLVLEIHRPNREAAGAILARHFAESVPVEEGRSRSDLIEAAITRIYAPNGIGTVAELLFRDGKKRSVAAGDLASGAVLAQVAQEAIEKAAFREADGGVAGVRATDVLEAVDDAMHSAAGALTPTNCRNHLDDLPQDLDVVKVERVVRSSRREYRYLRIA